LAVWWKSAGVTWMGLPVPEPGGPRSAIGVTARGGQGGGEW
jgi:hypothetical protein